MLYIQSDSFYRKVQSSLHNPSTALIDSYHVLQWLIAQKVFIAVSHHDIRLYLEVYA